MSRAAKRREAKLAARIAAANAPSSVGSKTRRLRQRQLGKLGDMPNVQRAIDPVRRAALDLQSPAFWRRVWD